MMKFENLLPGIAIFVSVVWFTTGDAGNIIVNRRHNVANQQSGHSQINSGIELGNQPHSKMINGNGICITRNEKLLPFKELKLTGIFKLTLFYQATGRSRLEIKGDSNVVKLVKLLYNGEQLELQLPRSYSTAEPIAFRLYVSGCNSLIINGRGNAEIKKIQAKQFKLHVSGASIVELSGESTILSVRANGVAKVLAGHLHCQQAYIKAGGVTTVVVNAAKELQVNAAGAAKIFYIGQPMVIRQKLSGAAKLAPDDR